ncbi:MarR family winged helix-turn-helix transcriptional regulator [Brevundimonas naejangsanensis]|uniref:MarR family winged helix-turn-helix transcriptional regulator n=1 Tax=Brevundimonas naejangsanensis TaxID=588932 RepID=UPI00046296CA|nr:helix-turn-helix domain-containing protein [Brevundimonas naejangsanensis]
MNRSLLMLDLVRTLYWFDEQLQARLDARGWSRLGRSQSLILVNVANGETRAARMAENLGVSRQAMSQFLTEMVDRKLLELAPDPHDKRARIVRFAPESQAIRDDAQKVLRELESELENAVGSENLEALRQGLRNFLGGLEPSIEPRSKIP